MTGKTLAFIYEDDQRSIIIFGDSFERYEIARNLEKRSHPTILNIL